MKIFVDFFTLKREENFKKTKESVRETVEGLLGISCIKNRPKVYTTQIVIESVNIGLREVTGYKIFLLDRGLIELFEVDNGKMVRYT